MKREVASSLVERGVTERVRLTQAYEKKRDELQKQHDYVKAALMEHKSKVRHSTLLGGNDGLAYLISLSRSKKATDFLRHLPSPGIKIHIPYDDCYRPGLEVRKIGASPNS